MEAHDFKYSKVLLFCSKIKENQYFDVCCLETSFCQQAVITAMYLVIPQCMCQVSLGLKEV